MHRRFAALTLALIAAYAQAKDGSLLNVSYDPARALDAAINTAFAADWPAKTGEQLTIGPAHGASSNQARATVDGLEAIKP